MPFAPDRAKTETDVAMNNPQPGDHFHEMYAFHVFVVARKGSRMMTCEGSVPCTLPKDGKWRVVSVAGFRDHFAYGSIPGYWVHLGERVEQALTWADFAPEDIQREWQRDTLSE